MNVKFVDSDRLQINDEIVNLGHVVSIDTNGVFVSVTYYHLKWNIFSGKGQGIYEQIIFHLANEVAIYEKEV